jgi:hypothetical protein
MEIGYNLWTFLRQFRRGKDASSQLWIDAVSIDQQNTSERNHQVAHMRDIYSRATAVIVWLGADIISDDAAQAFDLVVGQSKLMYEDSHEDMRWHRSRKQWQALEKLLNRQYWSRFWIIQEVILARVVHVHCGHRSSTLDHLGSICQWLENFTKLPSSRHTASTGVIDSKGYQLFKHREQWWRSNGTAQMFSLRRLFEAYISSKSSDQRDKVYALLGIARNVSKGDFPIHADYSKTSVEILVDVVRNQCQWGSPAEEAKNQRLVLLLKEALSINHEEVHAHVMQHASDLRPFMHILATTEYVHTKLHCIGTIIEVGFDSNSLGLRSKRTFGGWFTRPLDCNVYIDPERLSHVATDKITSDLRNPEYEKVLHQDVHESYGKRWSDTDEFPNDFAEQMGQVLSLPDPPPKKTEIFIGSHGISGITSSPAQSGDLICVDSQRPADSRSAFILRRIGYPGVNVQERTVGTAIISTRRPDASKYRSTRARLWEHELVILDQIASSNQPIYSAKFRSEVFLTAQEWRQYVARNTQLSRPLPFTYRLSDEHRTGLSGRRTFGFYFRSTYLPEFLRCGLIANGTNVSETSKTLVRRQLPKMATPLRPDGGPRGADVRDDDLAESIRRITTKEFAARVAMRETVSLERCEVGPGLFPSPPFREKPEFM